MITIQRVDHTKTNHQVPTLQGPNPIQHSTSSFQRSETHHFPRVYPSQSFEKTPPSCFCSFQLALRVAIFGSFDSRFCVCRFENKPVPDPALERRRSLADGRVGEVVEAMLALVLVLVVALPVLPVEALEASDSYVSKSKYIFTWRSGIGERSG